MSYEFDENFDVIVVGAGHAGVEASLAAARMGCKVLLATINLEMLAFMPCNPSIGGSAKGIVVREIDALGGEMGKNIDKTYIQMKMLNTGKGPAVRALRAQADKALYAMTMKHTVERQENLTLRQSMVDEILVEDGKVVGVRTATNQKYGAKAVVVTTGTALRGEIILGELKYSSGPNNSLASVTLADGEEEYDDLSTQEVNEFLANNGHDDTMIIGISIRPFMYPNTMFLTEKEAREHLKRNYYHYSEDAHTYCMVAWRSPEVEKLWKILRETKWDCKDKELESHEEKYILHYCISLMQELVGYFEEWYRWVHGENAIEEMSEEERFCYNMSYFHIVQELFLFRTYHSGGTSTMAKCKQLGVDSSENVEFKFEEEEEGE